MAVTSRWSPVDRSLLWLGGDVVWTRACRWAWCGRGGSGRRHRLGCAFASSCREREGMFWVPWPPCAWRARRLHSAISLSDIAFRGALDALGRLALVVLGRLVRGTRALV